MFTVRLLQQLPAANTPAWRPGSVCAWPPQEAHTAGAKPPFTAQVRQESGRPRHSLKTPETALEAHSFWFHIHSPEEPIKLQLNRAMAGMSATSVYVQRGVHTIFVVVAVLLFIFGCAGSSLQCVGSAIMAHGAQLPRGTWDLSSPTRDRTHVPCTGRRILNHWTTREVPHMICFEFNSQIASGNWGWVANSNAFLPPLQELLLF